MCVKFKDYNNNREKKQLIHQTHNRTYMKSVSYMFLTSKLRIGRCKLGFTAAWGGLHFPLLLLNNNNNYDNNIHGDVECKK
jgi:hypothetical protein